MRVNRYVPKKISEIKDIDSKVSIIGKIQDSKSNSFLIEDETGKLELFTEQNVEAGNLVRVFCSLVEGRPKADVIQSLNGLDINLYHKVEDLYRKVGI
jgi:hypothetical protein